MHRRQFLAATAALLPAAAGCTGTTGENAVMGVAELPTVRLSMAAVEDADVAARVTHHELPDEERALLDRVVESGPLTDGWHQEPPLHTGRPVLHDGAVYRLSKSVAETRPAVNYGVTVDIPQGAPTDEGTVRFADLPEADRTVLARHGFGEGDLVGVGTVVTYTPDQASASVLVPESEYDWIRWANGETAEWIVDDRWETEQHRYRYAAERVATAEAYGRGVREEYGFELSGLSDGERDAVETAIEADAFTVGADATPSSGVESLLDRFEAHDEVAPEDDSGPGVSGEYVVRYDGTVYWARLTVPGERGSDGDDGTPDANATTDGTADA